MNITSAKQLLTSVFGYNLAQMEAGKSHNTYIVPFFVGDPGVGKTAIPNQVAKELGVPYHQTIIAQYDAGEMAGLPYIGKIEIETGHDKAGKPITKQVDRMIRLRPTYLPDPESEDGKLGIYNLDELPQAFLANQNIASQLTNEWRIGEFPISPGITMCCTGNKPENKAGTTTMPSHLRDRLMFIPIEADYEEWLIYAAGHGIDPIVRAYIRKNPGHIHKFVPATNAFPSPRSWEKVSAILSMKLPVNIRAAALTGQIGEGEAVNFETYIRVADRMPDPHDILAHPDKAPVFGNSDADILYLILANLADMAKDSNIENMIKYLQRLPNKEFIAMWAKDAFTKNKDLMQNKHVRDFKMTTIGKLLY